MSLRTLFASLAVVGVVAGGTAMPAIANADPLKYYVNCAAKTAGDGLSEQTPWNSLASIHSHGAYYPGEQILIKRGTTCTGRIVTIGSGVKALPIILGAYGSGAKPTIRGNGTANLTGAVQLTNQPYWTVRDLHVTNTDGKRSTTRYRAGVLVQDSWGGRIPGVVLQNLTVDHVNSNMSSKTRNPREWGGIAVITNGVHNDGFDGMRIVNNVVKGVGRTGLIVENNRYPKAGDTGLLVSGNRISDTRGDGLVVTGSKKAVIEKNTIARAANEWPCPECGKISPLTANAGLWTIKSSDVVIQHNEVYGTKMLGGDGEGIDVDVSTKNTVVQDNYVHDNQGGGILLCGSTNAVVRFNILEDNLKSALAFIGTYPAKNSSIYNNTIYAAKKTKASVVRTFNGHRGKSIRFFNNVVYSYASGTFSWPTSVWSRNNTYVGVHSSTEPRGAGWTWKNPKLRKPGSGTNGLNSLKGYRSAHPSTVGKGIAIPKSVTVDFFGKKVNPKKPPRGAAG